MLGKVRTIKQALTPIKLSATLGEQGSKAQPFANLQRYPPIRPRFTNRLNALMLHQGNTVVTLIKTMSNVSATKAAYTPLLWPQGQSRLASWDTLPYQGNKSSI